MHEIEVKAFAKINLTLNVLGKRPDGYHEVEMIMQSIGLHDSISIKSGGEGIRVTSNSGEIPLNENNLVYKAARILLDRFSQNYGLQINITKRIPVAAGLAGGSTDAAATLVGLNKLLNLGLSRQELMEAGSLIGSDVPFCISGGTALATGRGELVEALPALPEQWLVLAKPEIGVSTALVYKNFNPQKVQKRPDNQAMLKAIKQGDSMQVKQNLANVLESVTLEMYPQLKEIKKLMTQWDLKYNLMSGSGPTIFGIADNAGEARRIAHQLQKHLATVIVTHTT